LGELRPARAPRNNVLSIVTPGKQAADEGCQQGRSIVRTDHLGLQVSSGTDKSLAGYERALNLFHGYYGNPLAVIDEALAADPELLAGLALRAGLLVTSSEKRAVPELRSTVERGEALIARGAGTLRERAHIAAARAWLDERFADATDRYNQIALEHPRDMLAVQVSHLHNFFLGRATWLRDHVAHALPHHDPGEASHGYLLGMLAFGLEECGEYARAEESGRRALAQNRRDPWAVHAVAHCLEMQGRSAEGIVWMESRMQDWAPDNMFAVHNFWHTAVFHLDQGNRDHVLELYDRHIGGGSEVILNMVDASSLLWRLELSGLDVKARFSELAATYRRVQEEGYYAFNDFHALMAYAGAGAEDDVARVLEGLQRAGSGSGTNGSFAREVALPASRGFAAYARGDYAAAVDALFGVGAIAQRFGGSHAQRDVLDWTLVIAAQRAHRVELARGLMQARLARKKAGDAPVPRVLAA
jgi:tetratricopeptide (TPR) repeat protein